MPEQIGALCLNAELDGLDIRSCMSGPDGDLSSGGCQQGCLDAQGANDAARRLYDGTGRQRLLCMLSILP